MKSNLEHGGVDMGSVTERFAAVASTILSADLPVDPWLYRYCGSSARPEGAARYVRYHTDMLDLAWPPTPGPVVIDAGSGFGFTMIVSALLGASRVMGIELNEQMVASVELYLPLLPDDLRARLELTQGDVTAMPYEDEAADLVLSFEAISHYLDVDAFIDETMRVLRPGGALIIADGNNAANPLIRHRTRNIWQAAECGPEGQELYGHLLGTPYVRVREQFLEREFPDLPSRDRAELARRSAGFTEGQLAVAARALIDDGTLPDQVYRRGQLAIAPDGAAMERLFSPRQLARHLRDKGFTTEVYGYWGGAGGAGWIRTANRFLSALSPLTIGLARSFRVVAHKPPTPGIAAANHEGSTLSDVHG